MKKNLFIKGGAKHSYGKVNELLKLRIFTGVSEMFLSFSKILFPFSKIILHLFLNF